VLYLRLGVAGGQEGARGKTTQGMIRESAPTRTDVIAIAPTHPPEGPYLLSLVPSTAPRSRGLKCELHRVKGCPPQRMGATLAMLILKEIQLCG